MRSPSGVPASRQTRYSPRESQREGQYTELRRAQFEEEYLWGIGCYATAGHSIRGGVQVHALTGTSTSTVLAAVLAQVFCSFTLLVPPVSRVAIAY